MLRKRSNTIADVAAAIALRIVGRSESGDTVWLNLNIESSRKRNGIYFPSWGLINKNNESNRINLHQRGELSGRSTRTILNVSISTCATSRSFGIKVIRAFAIISVVEIALQEIGGKKSLKIFTDFTYFITRFFRGTNGPSCAQNIRYRYSIERPCGGNGITQNYLTKRTNEAARKTGETG